MVMDTPLHICIYIYTYIYTVYIYIYRHICTIHIYIFWKNPRTFSQRIVFSLDLAGIRWRAQFTTCTIGARDGASSWGHGKAKDAWNYDIKTYSIYIILCIFIYIVSIYIYGIYIYIVYVYI